ncbi:MAG: hypothetical protein AVDCRST_MAG59-3026 [uncultured Thermomicrobiales bacterium]|uniref:Uncharacterized protein n=1 Tax=uncultured Thermomicrobiales bacterium TaxID=1645740 RepID=A0A6J4V0G1_9BACT|nr:MAG: hypothetical protein AVDCRST_MAG59-3026 [uncultured Thermomicrobiales bacterium]
MERRHGSGPRPAGPGWRDELEPVVVTVGRSGCRRSSAEALCRGACAG